MNLRLLEETHNFPTQFVFKVIGTNSPEFLARVLQAAVLALGPSARPQVRIRISKGGKHQAVAISMHVMDAESVLHVYAWLRIVPDVRFLL